MTTVQLNAKKLEIIGLLMNTDDEKTVTKLLNIARKAEGELPGRIPGLAYTREELRKRAVKADADLAAGRFVSHEDIRPKAI